MRTIVLAASLVLVGCGDDPPKKYDSYQECFDDKVTKNMEPKIESIVSCCIDHEIDNAAGPVCGAEESDCINYLTLSLKQTDADITIQTEACAAYVAAKAE
jgi:hypothetical protein